MCRRQLESDEKKERKEKTQNNFEAEFAHGADLPRR